MELGKPDEIHEIVVYPKTTERPAEIEVETPEVPEKEPELVPA